MPIPPIPPHLLFTVNPATLTAVRAAAASAATSNTAVAGVSYLLASALAKQLWKSTPNWVRDDESWKAISKEKGGGDGADERENSEFRDEMASLTAVIQKLEALVVTGYDKLGSRRRMGRRRRVVHRAVASRQNAKSGDGKGGSIAVRPKGKFRCQLPQKSLSTRKLDVDNEEDTDAKISTLEWHAALLAYWQLCNQIRERHPSWRNRLYRRQKSNRSDQQENEDSGNATSDQEVTISEYELVTDIHGEKDGINQEEIFKGKCTRESSKVKAKRADAIIGEKYGADEHETDEKLKCVARAKTTDASDASGFPNENGTADVGDHETSYQNQNARLNGELKTKQEKLGNGAIHANELANIDSPTSANTFPHRELDKPVLGTSQPTDNHSNHDDCSNITSSEVRELKVMLDYAVWAYEPNEERLRSWLLTGDDRGAGREQYRNDAQTKEAGGYRLVLHRTDPEERTDGGVRSTPTDRKKKGEASGRRVRRKPPGRVGYFAAISSEKRTLLVGMKGTSTLEDLLTDCCGRAVRLDLNNDPHCGPVADYKSINGNDETVYHFPVEVEQDCGLQGDEVGAVANNDEIDSETEKRFDDAHIVDEDWLVVDDQVKIDKVDDKDLQDDALSDREQILETKMDEQPNWAQGSDGDEIQSNIKDKNNNTPAHNKKSNGDSSSYVDSVNVVSVSTSYDNLNPSESVEVELVDQIVSAKSRDSTKSKSIEQPHQQYPASSKSNKALLTGIPSSENVLLLPSPEILHAPSAEFIESRGIEMEENRSHKLRGVHEGILHCAQQLIFEITPLVEEYAISKGYDVVCTGHSLGASTAALLAVLIRGRYPALAAPNRCNATCDDDAAVETRDEGGTRQRVRAYAFAPPPVLDRASALACQHYVVSVANNSDIIPRSSLTNLDAFLTVLEAVRGRLVDVGLNPGGGGGGGGFIASTVALFRKLSEGTDGDLLLDPIELQKVSEEAIAEASLGDGENDGFYWDEEFGHHLFVPGKLLMMHEPWEHASTATDDGIVGSYEIVNSTKGSSESSTNNDDERDKGKSQSVEKVVFHAKWTNGMNVVLKGFEIGAGSGMFTDHLTSSYDRGLALLEQSCGS